eukprot:6187620-Pleurochrysis_carterae.AAC.1
MYRRRRSVDGRVVRDQEGVLPTPLSHWLLLLWYPVKQQRHAQPIRTGHAGDTPASSSSRRLARSTPGRSVQVRAVRPRGGRRVQRTG